MGQNTYLRILGIVYIVAFKPQRVEEMSGARDILICTSFVGQTLYLMHASSSFATFFLFTLDRGKRVS